MKYLVDTHTHTVMSGHAYSTLLENVREASMKGLKIMACTDHGTKILGGPPLFYFHNFKVIPRFIYGVEVLMGVEANIMDYNGNLDMEEEELKKMDIVIASLHDVCIKSGSIEQNTNALINAMDNKYIDILAHLGNPVFPIDIDRVLNKAKQKNILIEINNSSFKLTRKGSYDNCAKIAKKAVELDVQLVLASDAHISFDVGNFTEADKLIKDAKVPDRLIINTVPEKLNIYLKQKGRLLDM